MSRAKNIAQLIRALNPPTSKEKIVRKAQHEQVAGRTRPDFCECCGCKPKKSLHFDHDHTTGKFRGWLCPRCNLTLGQVKDSPEILLQLALYLERSR